MSYQVLNDKKFLDYNGLTYFSRKLNNYPTNDVIEAVVDGIQDALDDKQDNITVNGIVKGDGSGHLSAAVPSDFCQCATTSEWATETTFVPRLNEIIIYSDHGVISDGNNGTINVPGIKIGDGTSYLADLPFLGDDLGMTANFVGTGLVMTAIESSNPLSPAEGVSF